MKRDISKLPREPLSHEDHRVLRRRFSARLRSFFSACLIIVILILIEAGPMTSGIVAAIRDSRFRWAIVAVIVVFPATVFYRRVWIFRRDRRAGYKLVDRMLVIRKNEPCGGTYSIDLEDLSYHDLEVSRETYERLQPGDRYPVSFAARSGYPLPGWQPGGWS